jgi:hypothetical protein
MRNEKLSLFKVKILNFLNNLQNCKFLKTWTKMLCFVYYQNLMVDKIHAHESCGFLFYFK